MQTAQMGYILEVQIKVMKGDVNYEPTHEEKMIQVNKNESFLERLFKDKTMFVDIHKNTVNMFGVLAYLKLMLKQAIENPGATPQEIKNAKENLESLEHSTAFLKEYANILL